MTEPHSVILPAEWDALDPVQQFNLMRKSERLVRGSILPETDVDCTRRIVSQDAVSFHFNYPTGEQGSFSYAVGNDLFVTGWMESLRNFGSPSERIFILKPRIFRPGGPQFYPMSMEDLAHVASLMETYQNRCVAAAGHSIAVYVALASEER